MFIPRQSVCQSVTLFAATVAVADFWVSAAFPVVPKSQESKAYNSAKFTVQVQSKSTIILLHMISFVLSRGFPRTNRLVFLARRKALLVSGPAGCGKRALAEAAAAEAGAQAWFGGRAGG